MRYPSFPKILVLLLVLLVTPLLVACGGAEDGLSEAPASEPAAEEVFEEAAAGGEAPMEMAEGDEGAIIESGQAMAQAPVNRRIIYTASLQIRVEDPLVTAQRLSVLAQRYGGYVSNANIFEVREDTYHATVTLRVDTEQFNAAMVELRELGSEVLEETISTRDVTEEYVDLEARIENLERTEEELQILLTEARESGGRMEDILIVYRELTEIRAQIESLQGRLNVLADQVGLATITVELVPPEVQVSIVNEEWSISGTVRQALRTLTESLQVLASLAITFSIAVAPLLLIGGLFLYALYRLARWAIDRARQQSQPSAPTATPPAE